MIDMQTLATIANFAILPALGYLIALERRLVRLEVQLQSVLTIFTKENRHDQA